MWLNIGPKQSVLRIFARNFVQTWLEAPGSGSSRKKRGKKKSSSHGNAWLLNLLYYRPLWRPAIGRDTFSGLAPVLGPQQKSWLCHPIPLFMAVSMMQNTWHSSGYCTRHSWLTKLGVIRLNQVVVLFTSLPRQSSVRVGSIFEPEVRALPLHMSVETATADCNCICNCDCNCGSTHFPCTVVQ